MVFLYADCSRPAQGSIRTVFYSWPLVKDNASFPTFDADIRFPQLLPSSDMPSSESWLVLM